MGNVVSANIRNCARPTCNAALLTMACNRNVQANYGGRGRYYPAVITGRNTNTCTYNLGYCDGDAETNVPFGRVRTSGARACPCSRGSYTMNRVVTVNWRGRGRWFAAKICGCSGTTNYKICYSDGDKEANVPASRIRPGAQGTC